MDELVIGEKKYISSKRAAELTGYAKDYIGQLCREGRVEARLVGRSWYVLEPSITEHRFGKEEAPAAQESVPEAIPDWNAPKYTAETFAPLPQLIVEERQQEPEPQEEVREQIAEVKDMVVAPRISGRLNLLDRDYIPGHSDITSIQAVSSDSKEEPVSEENHPNYDSLESHAETGSAEEVSIPVHRLRNVEYQVAQRSMAVESTPVRHKAVKEHKRAQKGGKITENTILLAVAIVAISLMVIGTGTVENSSPKSFKNPSIVDYLGGKSFYFSK